MATEFLLADHIKPVVSLLSGVSKLQVPGDSAQATWSLEPVQVDTVVLQANSRLQAPGFRWETCEVDTKL